jgi:hypothetical protein
MVMFPAVYELLLALASKIPLELRVMFAPSGLRPVDVMMQFADVIVTALGLVTPRK